MATKRRKGYERGKYPIYDDLFDRKRLESNILNYDPIPSIHTIIEDKQNLQSLLLERVGDEEGNYYRSGIARRAFLPMIRSKLYAIHVQFEIIKETFVKRGFEKPTTLPNDLRDKQLRLFAEEDVTLEEIETLELKIKNFTDREQEEDNSRVLEYGLKCSGHFWGFKAPTEEMVNQLHDLDGQLITMHPDGFLIIDDKRSPYDGMKVSDYHKLAKAWTMERLKSDGEKLKRLQKEAKEQGHPVPSQLKASSSKKVDRNSLPKWPSWAQKHIITSNVEL